MPVEGFAMNRNYKWIKTRGELQFMLTKQYWFEYNTVSERFQRNV